VRKSGAVILATAILNVLAMSAVAEPQGDEVLGIWQTENGKSRIHIHECEGEERICGTLIWSRNGSGKRLGSRILADFVFENGRWTEGRIVDPRDGSTYRAKLELEDESSLKVRGCWLIFCGGQEWTRVSTQRVDSEPRFADSEDDG